MRKSAQQPYTEIRRQTDTDTHTPQAEKDGDTGTERQRHTETEAKTEKDPQRERKHPQGALRRRTSTEPLSGLETLRWTHRSEDSEPSSGEIRGRQQRPNRAVQRHPSACSLGRTRHEHRDMAHSGLWSLVVGGHQASLVWPCAPLHMHPTPLLPKTHFRE